MNINEGIQITTLPTDNTCKIVIPQDGLTIKRHESIPLKLGEKEFNGEVSNVWEFKFDDLNNVSLSNIRQYLKFLKLAHNSGFKNPNELLEYILKTYSPNQYSRFQILHIEIGDSNG